MIGIFLIVYALSCFAWWKYLSVSHSKGGRHERQKLGTSEVVTVFVPLLNTVLSLMGWICFYPKERKEKDWSEFFNIKK